MGDEETVTVPKAKLRKLLEGLKACRRVLRGEEDVSDGIRSESHG